MVNGVSAPWCMARLPMVNGVAGSTINTTSLEQEEWNMHGEWSVEIPLWRLHLVLTRTATAMLQISIEVATRRPFQFDEKCTGTYTTTIRIWSPNICGVKYKPTKRETSLILKKFRWFTLLNEEGEESRNLFVERERREVLQVWTTSSVCQMFLRFILDKSHPKCVLCNLD